MNATDRLFERYYFANPGFLNGTSEFYNLIGGEGLFRLHSPVFRPRIRSPKHQNRVGGLIARE